MAAAPSLVQFNEAQIAEIRLIALNDLVHGQSGTQVALVTKQIVNEAGASFVEQARSIEVTRKVLETTSNDGETSRVAMQAMHDTFEKASQEAKDLVALELVSVQTQQQVIVDKLEPADVLFTCECKKGDGVYLELGALEPDADK